MSPDIKNAIHAAVVRTDLTGARVSGFVICFKLADDTFTFQAQGVTPAELVAAAKAMEDNKGSIYKDRQLDH